MGSIPPLLFIYDPCFCWSITMSDLVKFYERAAVSAHMYLYILNECTEFRPDTVRKFLDYYFMYSIKEPTLEAEEYSYEYWEWKSTHLAWSKFRKEYNKLFNRWTKLG